MAQHKSEQKRLSQLLNKTLKELYSTSSRIFGEYQPMFSDIESDDGVDNVDLADIIYSEIERRSIRRRYVSNAILGEPAWDIVIDLFLSHLLHKNISVSSACLAANVPATTALRHLAKLEDRGMIMRVKDETDQRRVWLRLTPETFEAVKQWALQSAKLKPR
jgi:Winged helix DNA-binding domain